MHLCVYTRVYVYVYAYLCIGCGSQYQYFSVRTASFMRMCVRVHMYAYAYVSRYKYMCIFFAVSVACALQVFWVLVHEQVCTLHRCVFTPTYTSSNTLAAGCAHMCLCVYVCMCMHMRMDAYVRLWYCLTRWGVVAKIFYLCIRVHMHAYVYVCACIRVQVHVYMYVYVYMYVCVYVCTYIYICACVGVHMHSCRRILFVCTVQSPYYMRVYHRYFLTIACMCVGGLEVGFVSARSWLGLVTGVGGYVLAVVEIALLSCTCLYFCGC